jgi:transcriptional regulator with XRE-family HTH domain
MPSFGPALRGARQQKGISFDDVARDTRLSKRYLIALEDEAIHELPGGSYNRAYVRTYARHLGLDPESLVQDYVREEEAQTKAGRLAESPDVLATMRQAAERPRPQPAPGRSRFASVTRVGGFAGVAVALLVGLMWPGTRRFVRTHQTVPIGASARPAPVVSTRARVAVDQNEAVPPRLEPGTAGPGKVRLSPHLQAPATDAAGAARLVVASSGVGTDVVDQQLVGQSDTFAVGTHVAFWTHVTGGRHGDTVRHVWSHQGSTAGTVDLRVGGPNWRTQSRRELVSGAEGSWVVEARDMEGRVLARHEFRCAP